MRTIQYILSAAAVVVLLPGCVKDTIYNTDHPLEGKVATLTADWSDRGAEVEKPTTYRIVAEELNVTATSDRWTLEKLFDPRNYTFRVYNTPVGINVEGTVATVNAAVTPAGESETYIEPLPGWLLSGTTTATLEKDTNYDLTVRAAQMVRGLTLVIEPEGEAADNITAITASLSGVAAQWNMDGSTPQGDPANIALVFTKQAEGTWMATVRLLGVMGGEQKLTGTVAVVGVAEPIALNSSLTASLTNFNSDKKTPLTLKSGITVEPDPVQVGFTATIMGWKVTTGQGTAD